SARWSARSWIRRGSMGSAWTCPTLWPALVLELRERLSYYLDAPRQEQVHTAAEGDADVEAPVLGIASQEILLSRQQPLSLRLHLLEALGGFLLQRRAQLSFGLTPGGVQGLSAGE